MAERLQKYSAQEFERALVRTVNACLRPHVRAVPQGPSNRRFLRPRCFARGEHGPCGTGGHGTARPALVG